LGHRHWYASHVASLLARGGLGVPMARRTPEGVKIALALPAYRIANLLAYADT
jgi:hypothetical protein